MSELKRLLAPLHRRMQMMVGRAVIAAVNDGGGVQSVQVELLADETIDGVERFQNYGFTSHPKAGAEAVVTAVGGLRGRGIVVAIDDRRYRLVGLQAGEVALYDDLGQKVHLTRTGIVIEAAKIVLRSDAVHLGGEGGQRVARLGDSVGGGVITGASTKVFAA